MTSSVRNLHVTRSIGVLPIGKQPNSEKSEAAVRYSYSRYARPVPMKNLLR